MGGGDTPPNSEGDIAVRESPPSAPVLGRGAVDSEFGMEQNGKEKVGIFPSLVAEV